MWNWSRSKSQGALQRCFGEYVLEEYLGGGQFTKVYLARSFLAKPSYGRTAAVKILNLKAAKHNQGRLIKQFEREATIAMGFDHPNVVKVHNFGRCGDTYAIIMEYVEGTNLKEILFQREKLPLSTLLRILSDAAKGLAHIHSCGVVHKDVKPDNILVSRDLRVVKFTDFGIAMPARRFGMRDLFPKAGTVSRWGAISYVSPEQEQGAADQRSDIYSFGVTIDEVIVSKLAVSGQSDAEDYFARIDRRAQRKNAGRQKILAADLPVPDLLKDLIVRCTMPQPERRFQTIDEVATILDSLR